MRDGLQKLNTIEPLVEIPTENGGTRMVKQSEQVSRNRIKAQRSGFDSERTSSGMIELSGSSPEAKDMKLVRTKGHAGEIF